MSSKSSAKTLRPAQASDAGVVAAIEKSWPSSAGWTEKQLGEEAGSPAALFWICEQDGRVASYALARIAVDEAQIVAVGVAPERARQGLGRAALEALLTAARRAGLVRAVLEVSVGNAPAQALYRSVGLRVVGRRPKFYNDGSDALLMELVL